MIKINLLPQDLLKEESKHDVVIMGIAAGVLVVLLVLGSYIRGVMLKNEVEKRISDARVELKKYEQISNEVKKLESEKSRLEKRKNVIESLIKNRVLYSAFMYDFVLNLPEKIWVQNVTTTKTGDDSLTVNVTAKSFSAFSIADWIEALNDFPGFVFQRLGSITVARSEKNKIYSFSIEAAYRKK